jgi:hypothetical protein
MTSARTSLGEVRTRRRSRRAAGPSASARRAVSSQDTGARAYQRPARPGELLIDCEEDRTLRGGAGRDAAGRPTDLNLSGEAIVLAGVSDGLFCQAAKRTLAESTSSGPSALA